MWSWTERLAKRADSFQVHLLSRAAPVGYWQGESRKAYFLRRSKSAVSALGGFESPKSLSGMWTARLDKWLQHLGRHPDWVGRLIRTRDRDWLQVQRSRFAGSGHWSLLAGRTGTRTQATYVQTRWEQGVYDWKRLVR